MPALRGDYDPNQCDVMIDGERLEGFGPTSFFNMEPDAADYELAPGVDDTHTRERIRNSAATFTITTKYGSSATQRLSRIREDALRPGSASTGIFNLEFFDRVSQTRLGGTRAWIQQPPSVDASNATPDLEWTLRTAQKIQELRELPLL